MYSMSTAEDDTVEVRSRSIDETKRIFAGAVDAAEERLKEGDDYDHVFIAAAKELDSINLSKVPDTEHERRKKERMIAVLARGIEEGRIVYRSKNDVRSVSTLLHEKNYWDYVDIIEHYLDADEFMDMIEIANRDIMFPGEKTWARINLLYAYDTTPQGREEIPLEIRMRFAGCFDDIADEEDSL